jgi:hypothetical protein
MGDLDEVCRGSQMRLQEHRPTGVAGDLAAASHESGLRAKRQDDLPRRERRVARALSRSRESGGAVQSRADSLELRAEAQAA